MQKSPPPPFLFPQEARARVRSPPGSFIPGCWGPQPLLLGRTRTATQVVCARAPWLSRQVRGSPAACPPFRALAAWGGGRGLPTPTRGPCPPSPSPTWMYAIFARAYSLPPGHGAATATLPSPTGGGGRKKGSRVAPDVTGVADERRPPPRPCPSLRAGSGSGAASQAGRAGAPRAPASAFLVAPRSPGGAPQPGMGPGRLGASPGQPRAGTAATPAQAGPKTPGPERAGGGGGDRGRGRWEGAVHGAAPRSARGWHPPRAEPPGPLEPAAVWSWEGPPYQPSPRPGGKTLFPSRPTPPRTDGVRNAEAN